jgi:hypothetical protein
MVQVASLVGVHEVLRMCPAPHWVVQGWQKEASLVVEYLPLAHALQMRFVLGDGALNSYSPAVQTALTVLQVVWPA